MKICQFYNKNTVEVYMKYWNKISI